MALVASRKLLRSCLSSLPGQTAAIHNIPPSIEEKIGRNLHLRQNHPLNNIKELIEGYFLRGGAAKDGAVPFETFDSLSPIVSVKSNFDDLLVPADHVGRSPSDTFYVDDETVLRTHTSAHQIEHIRRGHRASGTL